MKHFMFRDEAGRKTYGLKNLGFGIESLHIQHGSPRKAIEVAGRLLDAVVVVVLVSLRIISEL